MLNQGSILKELASVFLLRTTAQQTAAHAVRHRPGAQQIRSYVCEGGRGERYQE